MRNSYHIGSNRIEAGPLEPALYVVATPIGNLGDMSLRGLEVLAGADMVACEDTRVSRVLLSRYGITAKPTAYHEHNADRVGPRLLEALEAGSSVALVSDAGTPLVSDPGFRLVEQALDKGLRVVPIPGASAPLAALVASGLPSDSFFFGGFLPSRDKARRARLEEIASVPATLLLFESPHRLAKTLLACVDVLGRDRGAAVCRELTKMYEEVRRGSLGELAEHYDAHSDVKGEIVLVIAPPEPQQVSEEDADDLLRRLLADHSPAKAATEAAKRTGLPRKQLYQRLLAMKNEAG